MVYFVFCPCLTFFEHREGLGALRPSARVRLEVVIYVSPGTVSYSARTWRVRRINSDCTYFQAIRDEQEMETKQNGQSKGSPHLMISI